MLKVNIQKIGITRFLVGEAEWPGFYVAKACRKIISVELNGIL